MSFIFQRKNRQAPSPNSHLSQKILTLLLFTCLASIFFASKNIFPQEEDPSRETESFKSELSFTQDETWFAKRDWANGLSETTQSRQIQPWKQETWSERVKYFVSQLRQGDKKIFLYAEYGLLDGYGNPYTHKSVRSYPTHKNSRMSKGVIWYIYEQARKQRITVEKFLTQNDPQMRKKVLTSILSGLFNKDPRVRLVAVNLLRRIRPDVMMAKEVKRALLLETITTERSKWRKKDMDIPSIENPRLGHNLMVWNKRKKALSKVPERFQDGYGQGMDQKGGMNMEDLLDGNGKGLYLRQGLYAMGERIDYPSVVTSKNYTTGNEMKRMVWTKASLLRYGADTQISGYEKKYGMTNTEVLPKNVYLYIDYRDPDTERPGENLYYANHNVWEEMKKLDLFITRVHAISKIKDGNINFLKLMDKDTFRSMADQIDGESLNNVPMKSKNFKIFGENEAKAIMIGALENPVVSTREECVRFLKRLYMDARTKYDTKKEIKITLKEARRRELTIDTIRGRHLHAELVVLKEPTGWWTDDPETPVEFQENSDMTVKHSRFESKNEMTNENQPLPEETEIETNMNQNNENESVEIQ